MGRLSPSVHRKYIERTYQEYVDLYTVAHACNRSTQGHPQLLSKWEASLGYIKPLLRRQKGEERERGETVGSCLWGLVLGT